MYPASELEKNIVGKSLIQMIQFKLKVWQLFNINIFNIKNILIPKCMYKCLSIGQVSVLVSNSAYSTSWQCQLIGIIIYN